VLGLACLVPPYVMTQMSLDNYHEKSRIIFIDVKDNSKKLGIPAPNQSFGIDKFCIFSTAFLPPFP